MHQPLQQNVSTQILIGKPNVKNKACKNIGHTDIK